MVIKSILYKIVELSLFKKKEVKREVDGRKKLLIVRIDAIGDFIIFSPMLKYYRMLYPDYHITLLVNKLVVDLAKRFNEVDELISFDRIKFKRNFIYRKSLLKEIKKRAFDVVIYPTYSREPNGDYIVRFSGAKEKIGFDGDTCNIKLKDKLKNDKYYTKLIPATPGIVVETDRNKEFVEGLGIKVNSPIPYFTPSNEDKEEAHKFIFSNGLKNNQFVVITPGAQSTRKRWPLEKYAEVVKWLKKEKNIDVVICGSQDEYSIGKRIKKIANVPIINIAGKTTLPVLAAILNESLLYIGNDTGTVHLAAAVGTPTICIIGGGHFGRFFPYGNLRKNRIVYYKMDCFNCNWRCIYPYRIGSPMPCISNIQVNDVLREIEIVLNEIRESR